MGVFKARETGGESTDCQSETEEAGRTINRFDQQHHQGHQDDQEIVLFCHHHVILRYACFRGAFFGSYGFDAFLGLYQCKFQTLIDKAPEQH